jgi:hypothetical protein
MCGKGDNVDYLNPRYVWRKGERRAGVRLWRGQIRNEREKRTNEGRKKERKKEARKETRRRERKEAKEEKGGRQILRYHSFIHQGQV